MLPKSSLRALAQAVPFQQTDHGERQQDDERDIAGLEEARTDSSEDAIQTGKCAAPAGDDRGGGHDQHRIEAQDEAHDDDGHAYQWP